MQGQQRVPETGGYGDDDSAKEGCGDSDDDGDDVDDDADFEFGHGSYYRRQDGRGETFIEHEEGYRRERNVQATSSGAFFLPPTAEESKWLMRRFLIDLRHQIDEGDKEVGLDTESGSGKVQVETSYGLQPDFRRRRISGSSLGERSGDGIGTSDIGTRRNHERDDGGVARSLPFSVNDAVKDAGGQMESREDGDGSEENGRGLDDGSDQNHTVVMLVDFHDNAAGGRQREDQAHARSKISSLTNGDSGSGSHEGGHREGGFEAIADGLKGATAWIRSLLPRGWIDEHGGLLDTRNEGTHARSHERGGESIDLEDNDMQSRCASGSNCGKNIDERSGVATVSRRNSGHDEEERGVMDGIPLGDIEATSLALWLKDHHPRDAP